MRAAGAGRTLRRPAPRRPSTAASTSAPATSTCCRPAGTRVRGRRRPVRGPMLGSCCVPPAWLRVRCTGDHAVPDVSIVPPTRAAPAQAAPRRRATGTGAATRACSAMSTGARPSDPAAQRGAPCCYPQGLQSSHRACPQPLLLARVQRAACPPRLPPWLRGRPDRAATRGTGRPLAGRAAERAARARRKKDMVSAAVQAKARREQGGAGAARGAKCAAKGARAPGERPRLPCSWLGQSACSGSRCGRVGCGGPLAVSAHVPAAEQRPRHAGCLSV